MRRAYATCIPAVLTVLLSALAFGDAVRAQPVPQNSPINGDSLLKAQQANDSLLAQLVESPKGFVARIPETARLDSSRSGWNPKKRYERRVYEIEGAGAFVFTTTVKETAIPEHATRTSAYTYVERDSLSSAGTIRSRTYYLPTRSVRIDLIPYGVAMWPYMEKYEVFFQSFRWKPGAETTAVDVDRGNAPKIPDDITPSTSLGG